MSINNYFVKSLFFGLFLSLSVITFSLYAEAALGTNDRVGSLAETAQTIASDSVTIPLSWTHPIIRGRERIPQSNTNPDLRIERVTIDVAVFFKSSELTDSANLTYNDGSNDHNIGQQNGYVSLSEDFDIPVPTGDTIIGGLNRSSIETHAANDGLCEQTVNSVSSDFSNYDRCFVLSIDRDNGISERFTTEAEYEHATNGVYSIAASTRSLGSLTLPILNTIVDDTTVRTAIRVRTGCQANDFGNNCSGNLDALSTQKIDLKRPSNITVSFVSDNVPGKSSVGKSFDVTSDEAATSVALACGSGSLTITPTTIAAPSTPGSGSTTQRFEIQNLPSSRTYSSCEVTVTDGKSNSVTATLGSFTSPDTTAPTVASIARNTTGDQDTVVNAPFGITITFSESVNDFDDSDDISVTNATVTAPSGSGTSYTATVTPNTGLDRGDTIVISVGGGKATDIEGNPNTASGGTVNLTVSADTTAPTFSTTTVVAKSGTTTSGGKTYFNTSDVLTVTSVASEDLGSSIDVQMTIGSGSAQTFTLTKTTGTTYSADYSVAATDTGDNVVINYSGVQDAANNASNTPNFPQSSFVFDSVRPTTTINRSANTVPSGNFTVAIVFGKPVSGFTQSEVSVTNGTITGLSGSGSSYTATINPTDDFEGNVTISVNENVANDVTGNLNRTSNTLTVTVDTQAPVLTEVTAISNPTNDNTPSYVFSSDEAGTITYSTGCQTRSPAVTSISANTNTTITFAQLADSTYAACILTVTDNNVDPAVSSTITIAGFRVDTQRPTPTVSRPAGATGNVNGDFPVVITFDEPVNGFDVAGDISVSNGTVTAPTPTTSGSKTSFRATVTPTSSGAVTVTIEDQNKATDDAGNQNQVSNTLTVTADLTAPTVTITRADGLTRPVNGVFSINISFSETVTGFEQTDITVTGSATATVTDFSGSGRTYSAEITPTVSGELSISIAAAVAEDATKNKNLVSGTLTINTDFDRPGVSITRSRNTTETGDFDITITFDEPVTGFAASEITVSGEGRLKSGSFDDDNAPIYTATIEVNDEKENKNVTIGVAANVASDAATNQNTAATNLVVPIDTFEPTVSVTRTSGSGTVTGDFGITIIFSETVTGFESGDISVSNGQVKDGSFAAVSGSDGRNYTATVTPTDELEGTVSVSIAKDVATDAAGNNNEATVDALPVAFDTLEPTVTGINYSGTTTVGDTNFDVTVSFSESVTDFDDTSDVTVTNAVVNSISVSGNSYTVTINPNSGVEGNVTVDIPAGVAIDAAGNNNEASASSLQETISIDTKAPEVSAQSLTKIQGGGSAAFAKVGDRLRLAFTVHEALKTNPSVVIASQTVTATDSNSDLEYIAEIAVTSSDAEGQITYNIGELSDALGNTVDPASVQVPTATLEIDRTPPSIGTPTRAYTDERPAGGKNYVNVGDTITITYQVNEPIQGTSPITATLTAGSTTNRTIELAITNSNTTLSGTYTVRAGDNGENMSINIPTITDRAGNTFDRPDTEDDTTIVFDTTNLTVTGPTIVYTNTVSSGGSRLLNAGDTIQITYQVDEPIQGTSVTATLTAGSTTGRTVDLAVTNTASNATLSGTYTVQAGDNGNNLIIDLPEIKDFSDNAHNRPADTVSNLKFDTVDPAITAGAGTIDGVTGTLSNGITIPPSSVDYSSRNSIKKSRTIAGVTKLSTESDTITWNWETQEEACPTSADTQTVPSGAGEYKPADGLSAIEDAYYCIYASDPAGNVSVKGFQIERVASFTTDFDETADGGGREQVESHDFIALYLVSIGLTANDIRRYFPAATKSNAGDAVTHITNFATVKYRDPAAPADRSKDILVADVDGSGNYYATQDALFMLLKDAGVSTSIRRSYVHGGQQSTVTSADQYVDTLTRLE